MTLIPEGARHIRAAHRSRNHLGIAGSEGGGAPLAARIPRGGRWQGRGDGQGHFQGARADPSLAALMGGDGRYVLNGNWAVSPAGTYEAAGTRVVYTRATGPEETLRAAGPTSEDLLLQVGAGLRGQLGVGIGSKNLGGEHLGRPQERLLRPRPRSGGGDRPGLWLGGEVAGTSQGNPGFYAVTRERPRESFFNPS